MPYSGSVVSKANLFSLGRPNGSSLLVSNISAPSENNLLYDVETVEGH